METNDLNKIFDQVLNKGSLNSDPSIEGWEQIQAEIPELSDIDLEAKDFPSQIEISEMLNSEPIKSDLGISLKLGGAFLSLLIVVGFTTWFTISQFLNSKETESLKEIALVDHKLNEIEEPQQGEFVDVKLDEVKEDPKYYFNNVMNPQELSRDDLRVPQIEARGVQPIFYHIDKDGQRVTRYSKDYNHKFIKNYKIYDYSNRLTTYNYDEDETLDPRFSNWSEFNFYEKSGLNYQDYEELLSKAFKYMNKERFREVDLILFTVIKSYPEDENAWFYSGISSYRQKKYAEALDCFERVIEIQSLVFRPECEWYKSLCLLNIGEDEKAIEELNVIANSGGFYEDHARELLAKKGK
ncbi:MAG: tetratricopeptide repeat protein [Salibacteraceae bacterium]